MDHLFLLVLLSAESHVRRKDIDNELYVTRRDRWVLAKLTEYKFGISFCSIVPRIADMTSRIHDCTNSSLLCCRSYFIRLEFNC